MTGQQRFEIINRLGQKALFYIACGNPKVIYCGELEFVSFWLYGQECEYHFHTDPPLLMQVETGKEFTGFNQLLEEVREPHHIPTV
jgi:hypothetical protein